MTQDDDPKLEIEFIYSETCPDCPPAKEILEKVIEDFEGVNVEYIKVKNASEKLKEYDITHIPTVIIDGEVAHVETVEEKELRENIERKKEEI